MPYKERYRREGVGLDGHLEKVPLFVNPILTIATVLYIA